MSEVWKPFRAPNLAHFYGLILQRARFVYFGGPDRIRTDDPHNANVVRSQLRYRPIFLLLPCLFVQSCLRK